MRYLFVTLLLLLSLFGDEEVINSSQHTKKDIGNKLIIYAKHFETDEKKGITIFEGDVKMYRAKDHFVSQKLKIVMSAIDPNKPEQKREIIQYIATGDVDFEIFGENIHYKGKGGSIVYEPQKHKYKVSGDGDVEDLIANRKLVGDIIYIDMISGEANVEGSENKPVRFEMNLGNN